MQKPILLLFLVSIFLVSCSQKSPQTKLRVSLGAISGSANFPGGLVLAGTNDKGDKFVQKVSESDNLIIELPNGKWNFTAVGWDSNVNSFEGNSYCDIKPNIELLGEDISFSLNATILKCSLPNFGTSSAGGPLANTTGFYPIEVHSCLNIKPYLLRDGSQAAPTNLNCDGSDKDLPGSVKSFRVIIPNIKPTGETIVSTGINSSCIDITASKAATNLKLPFGSNNLAIPYIVQGFSEAACTGVIQNYNYSKGFNSLTLNSDGGATPDSANEKVLITLHSDACTEASKAAAPFAVTGGTNHIICTAAQFQQIASSGYESDHYELGANIDFLGSNSTIMSTFTGSIDGRGFSISNGNNPLFQTFSGNYSKDQRIENIKIKNFAINIAAPSYSSYGVLVNNITSNGSTYRSEYSDIEILNSSLSVTGGADIIIGGLVGTINFNSAVAQEYLTLRNNKINVNLLNTSTGTMSHIGGIAGKASTIASPDSGVNLEFNSVGNPVSIIQLIGTDQTKAQGGLIGYAENIEIRDGNSTHIKITGDQKLGGLIGESKESRISNSRANIEVIPITTVSYAGGAIGGAINDSNLYIDGVITEFKLIDSSVTSHTKVGGIIGSINNTTAYNIEIKNSKATVDIMANGNFFGGIGGSISNVSPMSNPLNVPSSIYGSIVQGQIKTSSSLASNNTRGSFLGQANNTKIKMSIATSLIEGSSKIGGAIGVSNEGNIIHNSYIKSTLTNTGAESSLYMGGVIGYSSGGGTTDQTPYLSGNEISVDLQNAENCFTDDSKTCGAIIGSHQVTSLPYTINNSIIDVQDVDASLFAANGTTDLTNTMNTSTTVNFTDLEFDNTTCPAVGDFISIAGSCIQEFHALQKQFGYLTDALGERYLTGSLLEPFTIEVPADWNMIGENEFFMKKTFALKNDIDFAFGTINSIGSFDKTVEEKVFGGRILSNGFRLKNISFAATSQAGATSYGIIPNLKNGSIGSYHNPLIVENITIDNSAGKSHVGFIGYATQSQINLIIKNATYTSAGGVNFGGLVGQVDQDVRIEHSGFEGSITGGTVSVGGLIGGFVSSKFGNSISSSYAELIKISGDSSVGGFVGDISSTINFSIRDSYVRIDPNQLNDPTVSGDQDIQSAINSLVGGFVGSSQSAYSINNSFVDLTNSTTGSTFDPISMGSTNPTVANVYFIDPTNSFTTTVGSVASSLSNIALAEVLDDHDFTLDPNGRVTLYWQLHGFDEDK